MKNVTGGGREMLMREPGQRAGADPTENKKKVIPELVFILSSFDLY